MGEKHAMAPAVVLVVEDDPNIADLLDMYLRQTGHRPYLASDGERGLEVFAEQAPDLVILDIPGRTLNVKLSEEELTDRQANWQPIPPNYTTGALAKYAKLVSSASQGAVTH